MLGPSHNSVARPYELSKIMKKNNELKESSTYKKQNHLLGRAYSAYQNYEKEDYLFMRIKGSGPDVILISGLHFTDRQINGFTVFFQEGVTMITMMPTFWIKIVVLRIDTSVFLRDPIQI